MIVADANLLVYFHVETAGSPNAEAVFARDAEWHSPLLWRSEFANALARMVRAKLIAQGDARSAMSNAIGFMAPREHAVDHLRVLELAGTSGCSAYDCEYVALAEDLETVVVTNDRQILRAFPDRTVSLADFARSS